MAQLMTPPEAAPGKIVAMVGDIYKFFGEQAQAGCLSPPAAAPAPSRAGDPMKCFMDFMTALKGVNEAMMQVITSGKPLEQAMPDIKAAADKFNTALGDALTARGVR